MSEWKEYNRLGDCRFGKFLYNFHDIYIGRSIELYGEYSHGETAIFEQFVKPGQVVLDVGSNVGYHTVGLANMVGPTGTVVAFEPQRIIFQTMCANVALNSLSNVRTWHAAVGSRPDALFVPMLDYATPTNFGGLSLGPHQQGERVRVLTIDQLNLNMCDFIKIDVEGMEEEVLRGGVQTISRHQPIIYTECNRADQAESLVRHIHALGYDMYFHQPPLFNPDNYKRHSENVFGEIVSKNLLCVSRARNIVVEGLGRVDIPGVTK